MSYFKASKQLPFQPDDVFSLVSDIASYPNFIKWITAMRVRDETSVDGNAVFIGDAIVGFKGFTERFTTKVTTDQIARTVRADLVSGPFRRLEAIWIIQRRLEGGCDCALAIDYDFSNPLIRMLASANQNMAAERIMNAFVEEAERRFGKPAFAPESES